MTDLISIQQKLKAILNGYKPTLRVTHDTPEKYEVTGTIKTMQGKKEVDGFYFASVIPKPKDVRFYFFPIYTHKDEIGELPTNLKKALKGKSCFHIKKMDEDFENNLRDLVEKSIHCYRSHGLLK